MNTIIAILSLFALQINISVLLAYIFGVKLQIEDSSCEEEKKNVNITALKFIQAFNVIFCVLTFITMIHE